MGRVWRNATVIISSPELPERSAAGGRPVPRRPADLCGWVSGFRPRRSIHGLVAAGSTPKQRRVKDEPITRRSAALVLPEVALRVRRVAPFLAMDVLAAAAAKER